MAHLVWERFGDVPNSVEPFFGGGSVLLGRPHAARVETVNDLTMLVGLKRQRADELQAAASDDGTRARRRNAQVTGVPEQEALIEDVANGEARLNDSRGRLSRGNCGSRDISVVNELAKRGSAHVCRLPRYEIN